MRRYLQLFRKVGVLKETDREGWKRVGIEDVESVADHCFRSALIALVLGDRLGLNSDKLVKMLLIHDLPEVETGDITPYDGISKKEKRSMEKEVMEELLPPIEEKKELIEIWNEFEHGQSKETKIARDIDRLEMMLQAIEYNKSHPKKEISEFIVEYEAKFETEEIKEIADHLVDI